MAGRPKIIINRCWWVYLEDQAASADFQIGGRLISRNEELKIAAKIGREASKTPLGRYTACYHARYR